jgi:formate hydrogenlyase subunit 3/multisubunit Na+/H+ antiporter MnhD subunit
MTAIAPDTLVLNWLLGLPFFAAICVELFPRLVLRVHSEREAEAMKRGPFYLGALVCVMGLGLTVCLFPLTLAGRPVGADYWWTRDLYHLRFQADALSTLVVLALYGLGLLIQLHLGGQPNAEAANHRAALLLVGMGCGVVAALSADLILLVFSLEAALLSFWLLASLEAPRPADHLLATAHVGGLLTLAGVLMMWQEAGDSSVAALPLLLMSSPPAAVRLMGLLVVLGLVPRLACVPGHGWLPRLSASGVPAALAPAVLLPVIAGAALLRLVPGTLLLATIPALGKLGLVLGLAALWWGAVRAWLSHELRQLACWLTVAGSGYLLIALGAAASPNAPPQLLQAAALHLLAAPLALLAVWCSAGAVSACVGSDCFAGLSGLGRKMPLAAAALLVGGLSLVGLPPLPGFHPQRLLLSGLVQSGWSWLAAAIVFADVLIAVAVLDAFRKAFLRREPPPALRWASGWLSVNLAVAVLGLLVVGVWSAPLIGWSEMVFRGALSISP